MVGVRVVLLAVGSRGDVQPMVTLGGELRRRGATVVVVALRDYAALVGSAGLTHLPIDRAMTESLAAVPDAPGRIATGTSGYVRGVSAWLSEIAPQVVAAELEAVQPGDLVVSGLLSVDDALALSRGRGCAVVHALLSPLLPSVSGPSGLVAARPELRTRVNRWAGAVGAAAAAGMCTTTGRLVREQLGLPRTSARGFVRLLRTVPTLLAVSPVVTPPAPDWPDHVRQTGFWFGAEEPCGPPPAGLVEFLSAGEPPVYFGLGSTPSRDPGADVRLAVEAARRCGRRLVVRLPDGWDGSPVASPQVHPVWEVCHRWLFPRTAAVVHHGGAGTTAEALRAGVPNAVVAFGADQPYFGRRLHALGVGPAPLPRRRLTVESLAGLITELTRDRDHDGPRENAAAVATRIRQEDGVVAAADWLAHRAGAR
jgi:UDP:flavonoid glycosyltransferase YjiC (YdhE family)